MYPFFHIITKLTSNKEGQEVVHEILRNLKRNVHMQIEKKEWKLAEQLATDICSFVCQLSSRKFHAQTMYTHRDILMEEATTS